MIIEIGTLELLDLLDKGTTAQKNFTKELSINEFKSFIESWEELINENIQCNPSNYKETLSNLDIRSLLNGGVLEVLTLDEIKAELELEDEAEDLEPYEIIEEYENEYYKYLVVLIGEKAVFLE